MGADQSLPAGQTSDEEMAELAAIIASDEFRKVQTEFFEKHCQKFDAEEEHKLEDTQIHKEYEDMVEGQLKDAIGIEKMQKIELGLNEYIHRDKSKK